MEVAGILAPQIDHVWPHVVDMLRPAITLSKGIYTPESVEAALKKRQMQLWVAHEDNALTAALVTGIAESPTEKVCNLLFLGGQRLKDVWPRFDWLVEWAQHNGCTAMQAFVRDGLKRALLKYQGFQFVNNTEWGSLVFKDITHAPIERVPLD